jgi:hypothetical protein
MVAMSLIHVQQAAGKLTEPTSLVNYLSCSHERLNIKRAENLEMESICRYTNKHKPETGDLGERSCNLRQFELINEEEFMGCSDRGKLELKV